MLPCWLQSREEPSTTRQAVRFKQSQAKPNTNSQTQTSTRAEEAQATEQREREDLVTGVMKIEQVLTGERRGEAESHMCGDQRRGTGRATAEARRRDGPTERQGRTDRGPAEMHMNVVSDKRRCVGHPLAGDLLLFLLRRPLSLFFLCSPLEDID